MPITRRRSIDDLYDQVADYDLVLTTDAPLSLALNRRLDTPQLGRFAATPRMLAADEFRPRDDRDLFLALIEETDLRWKHCAYLVSHILDCWDATGDLDGILAYDRYDTQATRDAIEIIETAESAHREVANDEVDPELDVAVIAPDQFTTLDQSIVPRDADTIDPFGSGEFELPEFHVFESVTDIVDTVVDNVDADSADDIGIIMNRSSEYPALIESAFEAADIPFYGGPGFEDDEGIRTLLGLLRTAHADATIRVRDVRPVLSAIGVDSAIADANKRLHSIDDPRLEAVQSFCASIEETTFREAIKTYEGWTDRSLEAFADELDQLNRLDRVVSADHVDEVAFYLDAFDVPVRRDDSGVLLADAATAAYVDRPVVFYLGMDASWTHHIPQYPWVDADQRDGQYLDQFQLLLQNGEAQYYLVQDTRAGEPVTPCLYFHDLIDADIERFTDFPHTEQATFRSDRGQAFEAEAVSCSRDRVSMVSQSDLSTFVNCPRDYFFDQLLESPDRDYFRRGSVYHDYAEFAVSHPDLRTDIDTRDLVDIMMEEMAPFLDDVDAPVVRTEFRHGIETIDAFLDAYPPTVREYDAYESGFFENTFATTYDVDITSPVTERWFENQRLGGRGLIDLVRTPSELVDYKSGSQSSARSVVQDSGIDEISETPDFQAILYLAHHRLVTPGEELSFVFFHFRDLVDDAITGDPDLEDAITRITYYPTTVTEWVQRRDVYESLVADVSESNDRRKTLDGMGYDRYARFWAAHEFPTADDREAVLASDVATAFLETALDAVGDYKYVRQGARSVVSQLYRQRNQNYFKPDIDAFEAFLEEQIGLLNQYRDSRFPVGDPNYDRVDHEDLVITDE